LRIRNKYPLADGDDPYRTERGRKALRRGGQGECLQDRARGRVDEDEVAHVLGDERFAVVDQKQVYGPSGEEDLRARGLEDLIRGDQNPAVGQLADAE